VLFRDFEPLFIRESFPHVLTRRTGCEDVYKAFRQQLQRSAGSLLVWGTWSLAANSYGGRAFAEGLAPHTRCNTAAFTPHKEEGSPTRKLLRLTILAGLMVLFGAAEDGMVVGIGSAQARIGRPLTPMSYAGVARRTGRRAYRGSYYYGGYHY
jgi:hypothetical protein